VSGDPCVREKFPGLLSSSPPAEEDDDELEEGEDDDVEDLKPLGAAET
jgi:hypothetical protein